MVCMAPYLTSANLSRVLGQFNKLLMTTRNDPQSTFLRVRTEVLEYSSMYLVGTWVPVLVLDMPYLKCSICCLFAALCDASKSGPFAFLPLCCDFLKFTLTTPTHCHTAMVHFIHIATHPFHSKRNFIVDFAPTRLYLSEVIKNRR